MTEFSTWTDQIEVSSFGPRPDPNWLFIDARGHKHRYEDRRPTTLTWVVDREYLVDDGDGRFDEMTDGHYECSICGEHIRPGLTGPSPYAEYIQGMKHYAIDGVEVSPEAFRTAYAEVASTAPES